VGRDSPGQIMIPQRATLETRFVLHFHVAPCTQRGIHD
jgi:hypothetical protein